MGLSMKFALNDGSTPTHIVDRILSKKFDAMSIQISRIVDHYIDMKPQHRYLYEEINQDDMVTYARYMGEDNIKHNYPWFFDQEVA